MLSLLVILSCLVASAWCFQRQGLSTNVALSRSIQTTFTADHGLKLSTSTATSSRPRSFKMSSDDDDKSQLLIGIGGIAANLVCDYSLYVLKTTSCGLPAGPFGLVGATEGISYLAIVGILVWSLYTKVKTGSGLPAGPSGLLGAAEGLTFLTVSGGIVVAGLNLLDYGFLPGFLPNDKCQ